MNTAIQNEIDILKAYLYWRKELLKTRRNPIHSTEYLNVANAMVGDCVAALADIGYLFLL